ncbi:MAG: isochorismate synthase [Anaerolineales bacterium]
MQAPVETTITYPVLRRVVERGQRRAHQLGKPLVVSVVEPIAPLEVIDLFERARPLVAERFLWSQPGGDFALVGLGIAHALEAVEASRFRQIANAWRHLLSGAIVEGPRGLPGTGPLLLGGFAFDAQRPTSALWADFGHAHLVLPQLLYTLDEDEMWLTLNAMIGPETDVAEAATALEGLAAGVLHPSHSNNHHSPNGHLPRVTQRELRPAEDWQTDVACATDSIQHNAFEKVVLARAVQLDSDTEFRPSPALRQLSAHYRGCYLFAIARGESCFLGATPEQLLRLRDGELHTMSLAGSIRRGETPEADEALGQTLLDSAKDRLEQVLVTHAITEALGETCVSVNVAPEPKLLKLGNIQHLCTPIMGQLASGYTIFDLIERLHPTPAVGGRPREAALNFIREHEQLDRGWYAGPVGWVSAAGEGEFAVALRSALLRGHTATLFAGCGIMADSDPEREYAESELKLKPMLSALLAE